MRRLLCMMCLVILCACSSAQANTIVDFQDWAGGDGGVTSATSDGFDFIASNGGFFIYPHGGTNDPTKSLHMGSASGNPILTMAQAGGALFDLSSVDLQEGFSSPYSTSITITGFLFGGGTISQTFVLDGITQTYQAFSPISFSGLEYVMFQANDSQRFSVDNIIVPEPSTCLEIVIGMLIVLWHKTKELFSLANVILLPEPSAAVLFWWGIADAEKAIEVIMGFWL